MFLINILNYLSFNDIKLLNYKNANINELVDINNIDKSFKNY